jgi:single-strand DNA-binding protein
VLSSLRKGDSVIVHGRLIYRSYDDKQGNRRSVHELDAIAAGPDLSRWGADVKRAPKPAEEIAATDPTTAPEPAGAVPVGAVPAPANDPRQVAA